MLYKILYKLEQDKNLHTNSSRYIKITSEHYKTITTRCIMSTKRFSHKKAHEQMKAF